MTGIFFNEFSFLLYGYIIFHDNVVVIFICVVGIVLLSRVSLFCMYLVDSTVCVLCNFFWFFSAVFVVVLVLSLTKRMIYVILCKASDSGEFLLNVRHRLGSLFFVMGILCCFFIFFEWLKEHRECKLRFEEESNCGGAPTTTITAKPKVIKKVRKQSLRNIMVPI